MDGVSLFIIAKLFAAKLGRHAWTPFGNPQNLYLYGKFQIPDLELIVYHVFAIFIFHYFNYHYLFAFVKSTPMKLSQGKIREKRDGKKKGPASDDGFADNLYFIRIFHGKFPII